MAPLSANGAPAAVVAPVPPLAIFNVPAKVIVPLVVIGPPEVVKPVVPPDRGTGLPKSAPSILNCTVPVDAVMLIVAVKVTDWP